MTPPILLGLQERRRELELKRRYATMHYKRHSLECQNAIAAMAQADDDLMVLEFQIQEFNKEQSMADSEKAWAAKEGGERKWF